MFDRWFLCENCKRVTVSALCGCVSPAPREVPAGHMGARTPWAHGEKRGDLNATILFHRNIGRYQIGLRRRYVGDQYGLIGSDGWDWTIGFVRNPRASTVSVDRATEPEPRGPVSGAGGNT